ncbi:MULTISPECIES: hypothetical protein [unclassified Streptomyces]|uniref:hypothetical protein n=1 Tax=unclassified Streptomyces TaxID=2593676 RepID=UPI00081DC4D7|nr:hypothetical protein [Streptomyces sp. TverLS-915]SCD41814.1 hypothetical protein GA0115251_107025 [Streptomyces sp. TverLS-915]
MATVPTDLLDRIREIERRVRGLMASANSSPPMNQVGNGDIVVGDQGRIRARTSLGEDLFLVGRVEPDRDTEAKRYQQGLTLRRDDGSLALSLLTTDPEKAPVQALRVLDHRGNTVLATDAARGGLGRPYLPFPTPVPVATAGWQSTSATEWTTLYAGPGFAQHPKVYGLVAVSGSAGAAVRLLVNGAPAGDEQRVTGAAGQSVTLLADLPGSFGDVVAFEIQAKVATTGDTVACQPRGLYGVQS